MKQSKEQLESLGARSLSSDERERAWLAIESRIALMPKAEPKPRSLIMIPMPFAPIFLAIILLISGSAATAVASDSAIPGDVLYPLDRAIENIRLQFAASADSKAKLHVKFAEERFDEAEKAVMRVQLRFSSSVGIQGTSTPTSTRGLDDDDIRGAARAELALQTAINTLVDVKAKLEAQGNATAAAKVSALIEKLADLADRHLQVLERIEIEAEDNSEIEIKIKTLGDNLKIKLEGLESILGTTTPRDDEDEDEFEFEFESETNVNADIDADDDDDDISGNVNTNANVNVNVNTNTPLNIGTAVLIRIEAEVHAEESTEVHIRYLGGEAETRIQGKTRAEIVSELATKLNRSSIEIDAVLTVKN